MGTKKRLDQHLLSLGLASSRRQANGLIRAGKVLDEDGRVLDKPGKEVSENLVLRVKSPPPFVSRGGVKLVHGLQNFSVPVEGRCCIDGGISTGGFTDCLLKHGAEKIYGVDVGYGQTDWSLRNNEKVSLFERTNLRYLEPDQLYGPEDEWASLAVTDVSFISLRLILPARQ